MVGHNTIAPNIDSLLPTPVPHQVHIGLVVCIRKESLLPAVAALSHVVRIFGYNNPGTLAILAIERILNFLALRVKDKYGVPGIDSQN